MQLDKWSEAEYLTLPSKFQPLQTLGFAPQQMQKDRVRKFGASILTDESRVRNAVSAVTMAEGESEADAMWITRLDPTGPLDLTGPDWTLDSCGAAFKWKHHHFNNGGTWIHWTLRFFMNANRGLSFSGTFEVLGVIRDQPKHER